MPKSDPGFLKRFGWDDFFLLPDAETSENLQRARVTGEERGSYRLQWNLTDSVSAAVSGKAQFAATERADFPAVGDWVYFEQSTNADRSTIHFLCPRKSILFRKQVGSSSDKQILSTNVDFVFITTSVNDELNHRRIERYLSIAEESGVKPVVILTKADLCTGAENSLGSVEEVLAETAKKFPGVPLHAISQAGFGEAAFFTNYLGQGQTIVVIGSSGVGKSTLVNFLTDKDLIRTQDIRESDGRGRHTTTARNMYVSRFGGLVIDTPGMREMQLSDHAEGVKSHFDDIEELAAQCKFGNCQHSSEPGCAIQAALKNNSLDRSRWQNFLKLAEEVKVAKHKTQKVLAAKQQRQWKKASFISRNKPRNTRDED